MGNPFGLSDMQMAAILGNGMAVQRDLRECLTSPRNGNTKEADAFSIHTRTGVQPMPRGQRNEPAKPQASRQEQAQAKPEASATSTVQTAGPVPSGRLSPGLPEDDRSKARRLNVDQEKKPAPAVGDMPVMVAGANLQDIDGKRQKVLSQDDGSRTQGFRKSRLTAEGRQDAEELEPQNNADSAPRRTLYKAPQRLATEDETGASAQGHVPAPIVNLPYGSQPTSYDPKTGLPFEDRKPGLENPHGDDQDPDTDAGGSARMRADLNG